MSCCNNTCTICLEDMNEENVRYLPCCHGFHTKCINEWLKTHDTCPECRLSLANGLVFDGSILAMTDLNFNDDQGTFSSVGNQYFTEIIENKNGSVSLGSINIYKKDMAEIKQYIKTEVSLIPSRASANLDETLLLTFPEHNHPHAIARAVNPWDNGGDLYKRIKMAAFQEHILCEGFHSKFLFENSEELFDGFANALTERGNNSSAHQRFETFLHLCEWRRVSGVSVEGLYSNDAWGDSQLNREFLKKILIEVNAYPKYITNLSRKFECAVENKMFIFEEMNSKIEQTWSIIQNCSEKWIANNQSEREQFLNAQMDRELKLGDLVQKIKGKGKGKEGRVVFVGYANHINKLKVSVKSTETGSNWKLQSPSNYVRYFK